MKKNLEKVIDDLYTATYRPEKECSGYLLFVHGGPGIHSNYFEKVLTSFESYKNSSLGWICYDQRGCGRSAIGEKKLSHSENIADLESLYSHFQGTLDRPIVAVFGHSYGAWLARDFSIKIGNSLPCVITGMGNQLAAPRERSLLVDMIILKSKFESEYRDVFETFGEVVDQEPWKLSKGVREKMPDSTDRAFFYWANLSVYRRYSKLIEESTVETDPSVYRTVRETLYKDLALDETFLNSDFDPKLLWINGFHDFLMSGPAPESEEIITFFKSGHYPHIEQAELFLKHVQSFLAK